MVSWCVVVLTAALISVFVLSAPANAGVSPDEGRVIGYNGIAIIGETNLSFADEYGNIIPKGVIEGNEDKTYDVPPKNFNVSFNSQDYEDEIVPGEYKVVGAMNETIIYFVLPDLGVTTKVRSDEPFFWVIRGDNITFEANTNLEIIEGPQRNNITYKLLDPDRFPLAVVSGVSLSDISVGIDGKNSLTISTTGLELGEYTLKIKTDKWTNNGLDVEGPAVIFEIRSQGVTIEAEPKEPKVNENVVFNVSTTPLTNVTLNVTRGIVSRVQFDDTTVAKGTMYDTGGYWISGISSDNGYFTVRAKFSYIGAYEITATELFTNTKDDTWVKIVRDVVTLDSPKAEVYHIGEVLKIKGSVPTATDNVTIKIGGALLDTITANEFKTGYDWNTEELSPGTYSIEIWVLPQSKPERDPPDESVSIVLIRGGLFVDTSADFVALGDEFEIEKIVAPGRDYVDILMIAPEGGSGKGFEPIDILTESNGELDAPGIKHDSYSKNPDDDEFTKEEMEKIAVSKDVDTGTYLIAALNYGRDGVWGKSRNDNLLEEISNNYATSLGAKTTDQILAILKDKTINAAGSDDLLGIATISVEKGFVTLDDIDAVALNEEIKVTGTTNRQVDTSIIVTVEGLDEKTPKLKPKIAKVKEDPDNFYNKFEISFATASANIGAYEVTADDGDGHVATTTMNILLAVEPSVNVSATSTPIVEPEGKNESASAAAATPLQTPTPTAIEDTETEKQPGFEAVFSIAVLLVVTWLMLRTRQQRQRKDKKR